MAAAPQVKCADAADNKSGGQVGGRDHVDEAVGKRRIEDDLQPVCGIEKAVFTNRNPCGVCIQLLAERIQNAEIRVPSGDNDGCGKMHPGADAVPAKQHHPEK